MAVSMEGTVELLDSLQALSLGETGAAAKEPAERIIECQVISWNKSELSIQCACCDSVHSTAFSGYESNNYEGTFCPKSKKRYIPVFPDCFEANKDTGTLLKLHEGDPPKQWSLEADTEEKVLLADAGDTLGDPCLKIIAMIRHELRATNEKLVNGLIYMFGSSCHHTDANSMFQEQIDRIKYHNTTMLRNLRKQKVRDETRPISCQFAKM